VIFHAILQRAIRPSEADIEGGGENGAAASPAAGPEGGRGCNVVISDKRFPGDTHCAPLAASNPA